MRGLLRSVLLAAELICLLGGEVQAQDPSVGCVRDAQGGAPWCDDFEIDSGPNPQCYDTQDCTTEPEITRGCNDYYGWWDDNRVLGVISCDQNHTEGGQQSLALDAYDDTVRFFDDYSQSTSDFWILTTWIYIPSNMANDAYFIVNSVYDIDGPPPDNYWNIQCLMNVADGTIHDDIGGGELPLIGDQWAEFRAEINFAADRVRLFYGDQLLSQYPWTYNGGLLQIRAIDMFSGDASRYYYDDLSLCPAEPDVPGNGHHDLDGDVDLLDFTWCLECFTGPNEPYGLRECGRLDFEPDFDVDLADFASFQLAFTGELPPPWRVALHSTKRMVSRMVWVK